MCLRALVEVWLADRFSGRPTCRRIIRETEALEAHNVEIINTDICKLSSRFQV